MSPDNVSNKLSSGRQKTHILSYKYPPECADFVNFLYCTTPISPTGLGPMAATIGNATKSSVRCSMVGHVDIAAHASSPPHRASSKAATERSSAINPIVHSGKSNSLTFDIPGKENEKGGLHEHSHRSVPIPNHMAGSCTFSRRTSLVHNPKHGATTCPQRRRRDTARILSTESSSRAQ